MTQQPPSVDDQAVATLCRLCGRALSETPVDSQTINQLESEWEEMLAAAQHHGVVELVARALEQGGNQTVPESLQSQLETLRRRETANALYQVGELHSILDHLAAQHVDALAYKGPVLAELAYGSPTGRAYSDLDIFVASASVPSVRSSLVDQGYAPKQELTATQEQVRLQSHYTRTFHRASDDSWVDVHWRLAEPAISPILSFDALLDRSRTVTVAGQTVRTLGTADTLLATVVHGSKHQWHRLKWICDVAALLRHDDRSWDVILARARRTGTLRRLLLGAKLANAILGLEIPAPLRTGACEEETISDLVATVRRGLPAEQPLSLLDRIRFNVRSLERSRDRGRYLVRLATDPGVADLQVVTLPPPLTPLYGVIRPVRLAASTIDRLSGDSSQC